jgi:predicted Rossmann fold nucleotide-binding protein DprA/Smf involved in DNA uptake
MMTAMNLAIVGSRNFNDYDEVCIGIIDTLDLWKVGINEISTIISGGANGVDALAKKFAKEFDIPFLVFEADWNKYGKSAGPKRNTLIVNYSSHVVAFVAKDSIGTWDTIKKAQNLDLVVNIIRI